MYGICYQELIGSTDSMSSCCYTAHLTLMAYIVLIFVLILPCTNQQKFTTVCHVPSCNFYEMIMNNYKLYKAMQYIIAEFVNFYGATVLLQLQNVKF